MTFEERLKFKALLFSLKGDNWNEDADKLKAFMKDKWPKKLCRCRSFNKKNINALSENRMYFSKASCYDDPFDTYVSINNDDVKKLLCDKIYVYNLINKKVPKKYISEIKSKYDKLFPLSRKKIIDSVDNNIAFSIEKIQDRAKSICFTEDVLNENIWIKYADKYTGFCLVYDLADYPDNEACVNLYPIIYDNKPYNNKELIAEIVWTGLAYPLGLNDGFFDLTKVVNENMWLTIKTDVIKKYIHQFDREWRLIDARPDNNVNYITWKPREVVLGLKMTAKHEEEVIENAKLAGVENISQLVIKNNILQKEQIEL